jgi:hypothetical protein
MSVIENKLVPVDYDGNGSSDLGFLQVIPGTTLQGQLAAWLTSPTGFIGQGLVNGPFTYAEGNTSILGDGFIPGFGFGLPVQVLAPDFNGDGKTDQIFGSEVFGGPGDTTLVGFELATWFMDGLNVTGQTLIKNPDGVTNAVVPLQWGNPAFYNIGGQGPLGDFNGDNTSDILFLNSITNEVGVWLINNGVATTQKVIDTAASGWTLFNTNDFNGDGTTDLLFSEGGEGGPTQIGVWTLDNNANAIAQKVIDTAAAGWFVADSNDFDGNGTADLLLAQVNLDGSTNIGVWTLDDNADILSQYYVANGPTALAAGWQILDHNDFNGDGKADLVFKNEGGSAADQYAIWVLDGSGGFLSQDVVATYADGGYEYSGSADSNGDGRADLGFTNLGTQQVQSVLLNGTSVIVPPAATTFAYGPDFNAPFVQPSASPTA